MIHYMTFIHHVIMLRNFGIHLRKKYKTKDASAKKFVIGKFVKYIMVDTKTVTKQVEDFKS